MFSPLLKTESIIGPVGIRLVTGNFKGWATRIPLLVSLSTNLSACSDFPSIFFPSRTMNLPLLAMFISTFLSYIYQFSISKLVFHTTYLLLDIYQCLLHGLLRMEPETFSLLQG